ncbi:MAG: (cytosine-5)-methyltransferase 1 [Halanaerobiales bacterium]|nr:(cytosine-5)-methyltransferase 1 [Halanaerobiales bacterium]
MNVIDLFSGAGGFSEGFKKAGFKILAANEINEEIAKTYMLNHKDTIMFNEDIKDLSLEIDRLKESINYQKVDVIIGGPPCQGFSMAGSRIRKNSFLDDPRNYLFKYYYKIIKALSPDYFVMENVQGMLSSKKGKIVEEIERIFTEEGYKVDKRVLNAQNFGIPQVRKRLFIIGSKFERIDLYKETRKYYKEKVTLREAISDLNYLNSGEGNDCSDYLLEPESDYQKERRANSDKLYNHKATNHSKKAIERMKAVDPGQNREQIDENIKSVHSGAYGRLEWNNVAMTITTRFDTPSAGRVIHPELNRTLTPREAARVQSFDDNFRFVGSKSSIGKQIGNAVPPLLAEVIAKIILEDMGKRR